MEWQELDRAAGSPRVTPMPPMCPTCGYNLTGAPTAVCPECGDTYSRQQVVREADRRFWEIRFHGPVNRDVTYGLLLIAAGWVVRAADVLLGFVGWSLWPIPTIAVLILGVLGLMLGARVFRLARLPEHARELLPEPPNLTRGILALVSGALLLCSLLLPI